MFWYEKAALSGNRRGALYAADLYFLSDVIPHDYEKAFAYYKKATENGGAYASARLGILYKNGFGTQKDIKRARELLKYAAENGERIGECKYAVMLIDEGADEEKWLAFMVDAAKSSYAPAAGVMAEYYYSKGDEQTYDYIRRAAYAGDAEFQFKVAIFYLNGEHFKRNKDMAVYFLRLAKGLRQSRRLA